MHSNHLDLTWTWFFAPWRWFSSTWSWFSSTWSWFSSTWSKSNIHSNHLDLTWTWFFAPWSWFSFSLPFVLRFRQYLPLLFPQTAENQLLISSKALIWILPAEGCNVAEGNIMWLSHHACSCSCSGRLMWPEGFKFYPFQLQDMDALYCYFLSLPPCVRIG